MSKQKLYNGPKKRGLFGLIIDFILVFITGGIWLIWILIRYLRHS